MDATDNPDSPDSPDSTNGTADADDDARRLLATALAWARAIEANDADAIGRFVSDDWVLVDQDGIGDGAGFLSLVASGALSHDTFRLVDGTARVRVHGDTGVVTARVRNTARYGGGVFPADEWTSDTYVRTAEGWVCVLSHVTPAS